MKGTQSAGAPSAFVPLNPRGMTPTTLNACPLSVIVRPTIVGGPAPSRTAARAVRRAGQGRAGRGASSPAGRRPQAVGVGPASGSVDERSVRSAPASPPPAPMVLAAAVSLISGNGLLNTS